MNTTWASLVKKYQLSDSQLNKFKLYLDRLISWNQKFNLTAIVDESEVINYHFNDSLSLSELINLTNLNAIADIGSGAGFPGLPLKILYPHLKLILIEVNGKKVEFLKNLITELQLDDVVVEQLDWRAFLRAGQHKIDLFCARASLQVEELIKLFKPGCSYKNAQLVYWAAKDWQPAPKVHDLVVNNFKYGVGDRQRKLILFESKTFIKG